MTAKIIIAAHKSCKVPKDSLYLPLHVGAFGKDSIGFQRDDEGENISALNPFFCELTGLYWAWKNLSEDYIGLVHYRRYFALDGKILDASKLAPYLNKVSIFTPSKRRYYIETLKSHYEHTHYPEHLKITRQVITEKSPEYLDVYDNTLQRRWGYMFNMMIMKKDLLNDYCSWIFEILFEVYERIDPKDYSDFEKRYIGRISELLFNVWLTKQIKSGQIEKHEIKELELDVKENLLVKAPAFLKAKFFGQKYKKSF